MYYLLKLLVLTFSYICCIYIEDCIYIILYLYFSIFAFILYLRFISFYICIYIILKIVFIYCIYIFKVAVFWRIQIPKEKAKFMIPDTNSKHCFYDNNKKTIFFLTGCSTANFGSLTRGQPHSISLAQSNVFYNFDPNFTRCLETRLDSWSWPSVFEPAGF